MTGGNRRSNQEARLAHDNARAGRLAVDFDRCEGHGFCEDAAPELFALDDDGELTVLRADVPAELLEKAARAARSCPVAAIKLQTTGDPR